MSLVESLSQLCAQASRQSPGQNDTQQDYASDVRKMDNEDEKKKEKVFGQFMVEYVEEQIKIQEEENGDEDDCNAYYFEDEKSLYIRKVFRITMNYETSKYINI